MQNETSNPTALHQIKCYPGAVRMGGEIISLPHGRMLPDHERNEDERSQ